MKKVISGELTRQSVIEFSCGASLPLCIVAVSQGDVVCWLPAVLLVNYLLIIAAGLAAAYLVCLMYDLFTVVNLGVTFLLFVSGIFFDPRALGSEEATQLLFALNPLAFLLDAYRQILMQGVAPDAVHLALVGAGSAAAGALLVGLMRRSSRFLALRAITH